MTARGKDFLELWVQRNVLPTTAEEDQASRLAEKLAVDVAAEGLKLEDLEIENSDAEEYIRFVIVHVGLPGTPGD
jgi:hypothetical protein